MCSNLDSLLATDIQSRFDEDTVTNISVSVMSLENSDRSLSAEREKIARLSAGTRFHEARAHRRMHPYAPRPRRP